MSEPSYPVSGQDSGLPAQALAGTPNSPVSGQDPILVATGITKTFGGVHALRGVDLMLRPGRVLALAGENGAGKSTLIKVLTGIHQPDEGVISVDGEPRVLTPARARELGIAAVAQELSVLDHQSVAENLTLGREPVGRLGLVNRREQLTLANDMLARVGLRIDPNAMIRDLSLAQKQLVEIGKAMSTSPRVLILDEPTSGLREGDVETLLNLVRQLRAEGTAIVLITHRMSEMFEVSDEIVVLKDGQLAGSRPTSQTDEQEIVKLMVGRELAAIYPDKPSRQPAVAEVLGLGGFSVPGTAVHGISLSVLPGQIVALAGLAGQGQTQLLEGIAGLRRAAGTLMLRGKPRRAFRSVAAAIRAGVVLIPEDRKTQGLVLPMSIGQNISLPTVGRRAVAGWVRPAAERRVADETVTKMSIRPPDAGRIAAQLSGGNQQKVVIGKWLAADPAVVLCADPTRGIDVGTKQEIYALLRRLADDGIGVLMLSTDLSEVVGLADVVHVMAEGSIVRTLIGEQITEEAITGAAFQGVEEQLAEVVDR